ncbi:hypothetical protein TNCV_714891, partial [Trichonephila clavipes]
KDGNYGGTDIVRTLKASCVLGGWAICTDMQILFLQKSNFFENCRDDHLHDVEQDLKLMGINQWKVIVIDRANWRKISELKTALSRDSKIFAVSSDGNDASMLIQYARANRGGSEQLLMVKKTGAPWAEVCLCFFALAEYNGTAFTAWVTLPGDYSPDVVHRFRPGTPPHRQ